MSKPCIHCVKMMSELAPSRGYKIANVYYSDQNGEIQRTKLSDLLQEECGHVSYFFRRTHEKN